MAEAAKVSDWIAAPAPLNDKRSGERALLSTDKSIVQRRDPESYYWDCVCYTQSPLQPGEIWQITLLGTTKKWQEGLGVGVTAKTHEVPRYLADKNSGPHEWNYNVSSLWHNGKKISTDLPHLGHLKPLQTVGLLLTTDGELHVYHDGKHTKKVASHLPVNHHLWGAVDVLGICTKIKSELLRDPQAHYLKEALKEGYIPHKDDLFLIHGPGGVGKSSLISMFIGKQRDLARVSTAVAEESIHVHPVRDAAASTFTDKWELVDIDRQARMVAHTSHHLLTNEGIQRIDKHGGSLKESAANNMLIQEKDAFLSSSDASLPTPATPQQGKLARKISKFFSGLRNIVMKSQQVTELSQANMLGDDPDNIKGLLANFKEGLQEIMRNSSESPDLILYYSIRLLDSGGQPQFYEVASTVLPRVTGIVSVFKLSESLDVQGEVVFYKEGVQANEPYKSYLTNEQVIRHDLLAIQSVASQSGIEEMPSLAFVGTFLDKQDACQETPDMKDKRLHSIITEILPKGMQQHIISSSGSLHHVTFRVNARTPAENDYQTAGKLKDELMRQSRVQPKNLPLKWFGFEVALQKMMQELKRQILSRQECQFIGHNLGFDPPSLTACLNYLRDLHIISFYDILPNVVFSSCQVILDKITELVTLSLELKKDKHATTGPHRTFHQQGILSLDILRSEACSKHYSSKHFTPEDLLKVLKSLFIVTEVGPGKYLMPCVLEVSDIFPSPNVPESNIRSSFVLHFSKESPMLGIYCCTISYLLTKAHWKLLLKDDEVVQVARNSVTFQLPSSFSGKLIFLDPLSSYLEVVVDIPKVIAFKQSKKIRQEIHKTFIVAIKQAMKTLHYKVKTPELSFLCPKQSTECSTLPHIVTVDKSNEFLICSRNPGSVICPLTPDQRMWLNKEFQKQKDKGSVVEQSTGTCPTSDGRLTLEAAKDRQKAVVAPPLSISGLHPTLPQLLKIDLPVQVGDKFDKFGTILLNDENGKKMATIVGKCFKDPVNIMMEILREWLEGNGLEISWESIISTLKDCKISFMAHQIQMALDQYKRSESLVS